MNAPVRRVLLGALVLALSLSACSGSGGSPASEQSDRPSIEENKGDILQASDVTVQHVALTEARETTSVIASTRKLGLDVLASKPKETLVTSPASAVIALAMLGTTADGEAEDQLSLLLGAPGGERDKAVNALMGSLEPYQVPVARIDTEELPANPQVHLANQIVLDTGMKVQDTYLASLKEWYDSGVLETDLSTEEGFEPINQWVKENTAGLIDKSAVEPDPDLRFILQNAVVFASRWQMPFSPDATEEEDFQTGSGNTVKVPFMYALNQVQYAQVEGWQMLELPYGEDGAIAALYLLPPEGTPPTSITAETIAALEEASKPTMVGISVPKLDLTSSAELVDPLQRAGLTSVFASPPPALTHISKAQELFVSTVMQQGTFRLDEDGTVAAAQTEVGIAVTGMPPEPAVDFVANRPHIIVINDREVGWDLFQVLVNDPS